MFNFWRKYPRRKPKFMGYYLCTVDAGPGVGRSVKLLYFDDHRKWINKDRQLALDGYQVYKHCRATIQENRVYTDGLCERDDVIAWKKLPKAYGKRRK